MNSYKQIFKILGFVLIIFSSCSKDSNTKAKDTALLSETIKQSLSSPTLLALKQSYAMLSNADKQVLWDTKWVTILKNDRSKLTKTQKAIILSIKEFVDKTTIAALMNDPTSGETFIKSNLSFFEQHFSKSQLYMLIECSYFCDNFSIYQSTDYLNKIDQRFVLTAKGRKTSTHKAPAPANCECYYSIYCGAILEGSCVKVTCQKKSECGLVGTSNCNGRCSSQ